MLYAELLMPHILICTLQRIVCIDASTTVFKVEDHLNRVLPCKFWVGPDKCVLEIAIVTELLLVFFNKELCPSRPLLSNR